MRRRPLALLLTIALAAATVLLSTMPARAQLTEADVFVAEGVVALDDKEYAKALDLFRQALQREPEHVDALYYSAVTYMAMNRPADAVPLLERARTKAPGDSAVALQLGFAYFAAGDFGRAEPILEGLFARDPSTDSLGYYVGRLRYRHENWQAALRAFRANRTSDPNIAQVNAVYAAQALAALGLGAQAEAELDQARRLAPASPLTGPAERLRDSIAATRKTENRFRADVRFGGFYDDNTPVVPRPKSNDPTVAAAREHTRETFGELVSLRGDYDWLVYGPLTSTISYSYLTLFNNDLPQFNVQDHYATIDVHRTGDAGGRPYQVGVAYAFEYITLGANELVQRHSVTGYGALIESARHLTDAFARVQVKEYSETRPLETEEFQDAVNWAVGLRHTLRFSGNRHNIHAGYQFDQENARGSNFDYHGHRFLAGGLYTLPWHGIRLAYDFDLHYRDYLHRNTVLPVDRENTRERSDREYTHVVAVEVPIPVTWTRMPGAFTVRAEWIGKQVDSNIAAFAYDRNTTSLYLIWQY